MNFSEGEEWSLNASLVEMFANGIKMDSSNQEQFSPIKIFEHVCKKRYHRRYTGDYSGGGGGGGGGGGLGKIMVFLCKGEKIIFATIVYGYINRPFQ